MSDEHDEKQHGSEDPSKQETPAVEPWTAAFAQLEEPPAAPDAGAEGGDSGAGGSGDGEPPAGEAPAAPGGAVPVPGDAAVDAGDGGGELPGGPGAGEADGAAPVDVAAALASYDEDIEQRVLDETVKLFLESTDQEGKRNIRQSNGKLGATLNDPDIYRVDPDTGAPTFYNPDTGKPFTGDNPRAQAKQWVDIYNEELRDTFNEHAEKRKAELLEEMAPAINLLKFTPTFEKLDPTRQQLLEALIEDYEVRDAENEVIGYSCDLNQALAQVNRQVAAVQAGRAAPPAEPSGPALDMPTVGSGATGDETPPKDLASAMERKQDELLNKQKK